MQRDLADAEAWVIAAREHAGDPVAAFESLPRQVRRNLEKTYPDLRRLRLEEQQLWRLMLVRQ